MKKIDVEFMEAALIIHTVLNTMSKKFRHSVLDKYMSKNFRHSILEKSMSKFFRHSILKYYV